MAEDKQKIKDFPTSKSKDFEEIKKEMGFSEVIQKYPEAASIMLKYGLHCVGCHAAAFETIEQGCAAHGMGEEDVKKMLKEMNEAIKD